jgi:hypothetical protein
MFLWLAGCGRTEVVIDGSCALADDNALRATCTFATEPPTPLEVVVEPVGAGEPAVVEAVDGEHRVRRMRAATRYRWTATADGAERSGELETGDLPPTLALTVQQEGEAPPDDLMFLVDCGAPSVVVLDGAGEVVWYQEVADGLPDGVHHVVGLTWTPERTALVVVDGVVVREFALDGALVRELGPGVGPEATDRIVHHDVFRRDGWTWVLRARLETLGGVDWLVDGVLAYDAEDRLQYDWDLASLATPSGEGAFGGVYWSDRYPDALDWAHTNGIYVAEDHDFLVSMHAFSTVMRVEGDPGDPAYGTPVWVLASGAGGPWASDFAVVDPDGLTDDLVFGHQHHPSLLPDGTLLLFDNGEDLADEARVLQLALDPSAGEAVVRGSWPLGQVCPIEGGAYETSDGGVLGTCGLRSTATLLDRASGEVRGRTFARCVTPAGIPLLPRVIPVDIR